MERFCRCVIALLAVLFGGAFTVQQQVTIRPDGSGTIIRAIAAEPVEGSRLEQHDFFFRPGRNVERARENSTFDGKWMRVERMRFGSIAELELDDILLEIVPVRAGEIDRTTAILRITEHGHVMARPLATARRLISEIQETPVAVAQYSLPGEVVGASPLGNSVGLGGTNKRPTDVIPEIIDGTVKYTAIPFFELSQGGGGVEASGIGGNRNSLRRTTWFGKRNPFARSGRSRLSAQAIFALRPPLCI